MRLTIRNHGSYTYRASLIRVDNNCALGDIVDKLGKYEDIGEPEEFEHLKCEHEKKNPPEKARFLIHQSLNIFSISNSS